MKETEGEEQWQPKDVWLGLLLFGAGVLLTAYVFLVRRNGSCDVRGGRMGVGTVALLLNANAIFQSLRR